MESIVRLKSLGWERSCEFSCSPIFRCNRSGPWVKHCVASKVAQNTAPCVLFTMPGKGVENQREERSEVAQPYAQGLGWWRRVGSMSQGPHACQKPDASWILGKLYPMLCLPFLSFPCESIFWALHGHIEDILCKLSVFGFSKCSIRHTLKVILNIFIVIFSCKVWHS